MWFSIVHSDCKSQTFCDVINPCSRCGGAWPGPRGHRHGQRGPEAAGAHPLAVPRQPDLRQDHHTAPDTAAHGGEGGFLRSWGGGRHPWRGGGGGGGERGREASVQKLQDSRDGGGGAGTSEVASASGSLLIQTG